MDVSKLKDLIELMNRYQLEELSIEEGGFKAHLKKNSPRPREIITYGGAPLPVGAMDVSGPAGGDPARDDSNAVKSPLVGTFYRSPSPEADAFVEVGDRVEEGRVLCIIEAMKVMNEVKADRAGVVTEVVAENGQAVEYGTVLFRIV
ncbi:MAG: acetyl-CoA carboxylase biotin carboxyl carrier protein [Planctomycetota bacterium]